MIGRRIMYAVVQCNSTQDVKNTSYGRSLRNQHNTKNGARRARHVEGQKLKNILLKWDKSIKATQL
jgi:hypothetical protein